MVPTFRRSAVGLLDPQGRPVQPDRAFAVVDVPDPTGQPGEWRATIVPLDEPGQDGRFDYRIERQRPRLSFRKAGWRELDVAFAGDAADVRLVMEPYPADMPILANYSGLTFSPLGRNYVMDFHVQRPADIRSSFDKRPHVVAWRASLRRDDVTDGRQWPRAGVVLLADVTEEGDRLVVHWRKAHPEMPSSDALARDYIQGLRLVMTDGPKMAEEGGFQVYVPEAIRRLEALPPPCRPKSPSLRRRRSPKDPCPPTPAPGGATPARREVPPFPAAVR